MIDEYYNAIPEITSMPVMGSWGTVTYLMEPVLVSAGANNPRWRNFKEIALKQGPHACGFISWLDKVFLPSCRRKHAPCSDTGTHPVTDCFDWIPAFAGMTTDNSLILIQGLPNSLNSPDTGFSAPYSIQHRLAILSLVQVEFLHKHPILLTRSDNFHRLHKCFAYPIVHGMDFLLFHMIANTRLHIYHILKIKKDVMEVSV
jgi:hypothetical protein